MLISVQKYKLQYGTLSPILSTQITAPEKKISIHVYNSTTIFIPVPKHFFVLKFIFCTGIHIVVLLLYFSCFFFFFFFTATFIFDWDLYFCTGIYIVVLLYTWILLYWRIQSHNRWICLFWNLCFCTERLIFF